MRSDSEFCPDDPASSTAGLQKPHAGSPKPMSVWSLFDEAADGSSRESSSPAAAQPAPQFAYSPSAGSFPPRVPSSGADNGALSPSSATAQRGQAPALSLHGSRESSASAEFFDASTEGDSFLVDDFSASNVTFPPANRSSGARDAALTPQAGSPAAGAWGAAAPGAWRREAIVRGRPDCSSSLAARATSLDAVRCAGGAASRAGGPQDGGACATGSKRGDSSGSAAGFQSMDDDGREDFARYAEGFMTPSLHSLEFVDAGDSRGASREVNNELPTQADSRDAAAGLAAGEARSPPADDGSDPQDDTYVHLASPGARDSAQRPEGDACSETAPAAAAAAGAAPAASRTFVRSPAAALCASGSSSAAPSMLPLLPPSQLLNLPDSTVASAAAAAGVSVVPSLASTSGVSYATATTADVVVVHNRAASSAAPLNLSPGTGDCDTPPPFESAPGIEGQADAQRAAAEKTEGDARPAANGRAGGDKDHEGEGGGESERPRGDANGERQSDAGAPQSASHSVASPQEANRAQKTDAQETGDSQRRVAFRKLGGNEAAMPAGGAPGSFTSQNSLNKKKLHEDDSNPAWYAHKRHVFIFTFSGKPVYSRYGNEESLSAFSGALSAIVSKMESFFFFTKKQDCLRSMLAGDRRFVFLRRGPLYLVSVDSVSANVQQIRSALMLVHRQLLCILTKGIEKTLYSRPNFDVRPLLGGTDGILRNLLSHYSSSLLCVLYAASAASSPRKGPPSRLPSPSAALAPGAGSAASAGDVEALETEALEEKGGFEPLPLNSTMRHIANNMLKSFGTSHVLAGLVLADHRVVAMSLAKDVVLQPTDIILLINFVVASPALRQAESWTPVCLPGFNDRAFLYMYVRYLAPHVCYICLSSKNDGEQFFALSSHCTKTFALLTNTGCLNAIERSREYCPYSLPRSLWGSLALLHVGFFLPSSKQFFSSALSSEIDTGKHAIRDILKLYVQCDESVQGAKLPTHAYIETERHKAYVWRTTEFHLYAAVPSWIELTTAVLEQLAKWVMDQQPFLFITNIPTIAG